MGSLHPTELPTEGDAREVYRTDSG